MLEMVIIRVDLAAYFHCLDTNLQKKEVCLEEYKRFTECCLPSWVNLNCTNLPGETLRGQEKLRYPAGST
jgi:hypothetical protein